MGVLRSRDLPPGFCHLAVPEGCLSAEPQASPAPSGLLGTWPIRPPDGVQGRVGVEARTGLGVDRGRIISSQVPPKFQSREGSSGVKKGRWSMEYGDREGPRENCPAGCWPEEGPGDCPLGKLGRQTG